MVQVAQALLLALSSTFSKLTKQSSGLEGASKRLASGFAITFFQARVAEMLRQLAEYLWQFTLYNNYGNVVLKSSGAATSSGLQHTLVIASVVAANVPNDCDRIDVIGWTHSVDTQTGELSRSIDSLWDFGARRNNGIVELCTPP